LTPEFVTANFSLMATVKKQDGRSARMPAAERREAILEAAMIEFARGGLHGTATEDIARRAGITQPYVFRLFGTKKALYLETIERGFDRTQSVFAAAAEPASEPDEKLRAMGQAYGPLLRDRSLLLGRLHSYADCSDPEVRAVVRRRYGDLWDWVQRTSGASPEDVRLFFSKGMLLNVIAAMDLRGLTDPWVMACLGDLGPIDD
jgi:AcrR family transcriptional regulator